MKEFIELMKENTLFQFYSWMKLVVLVLYLDLFSGIATLNRNTIFVNLADIDLTFILYFILISAASFTLIVIFVLASHSLALSINVLIYEVKSIKIFSKKDEGITNRNMDLTVYDLSFQNLMDYALKENNDIFFRLAILVSQKYKQMKLNRYITTAAILLLCFDLNHGAILSNIKILTTDIKYCIYFFSAFICYLLLHKIAFYNAGAYKTYSKDLYDRVK